MNADTGGDVGGKARRGAEGHQVNDEKTDQDVDSHQGNGNDHDCNGRRMRLC